MSISFLDHVRDIEDPRAPGMVLYPLEGAIVTIDAMGTQKQIAAGKAGYVLALKGNQGALEADAALFFADPVRLAAAVRAHCNIGNNLHWPLDMAFREDESRARKDHAARNLAMIRRAALNMLRREPSSLTPKRKRLKAAINQAFRAEILAR